EAVRKAAYEALRKFELFNFENGFLDLIRARNKLARMLGYSDYYECTVQRNEGLSKQEIFTLLDEFEIRTRDHARQAIEDFVKIHGERAREPWNFSHLRRGSMAKEQDPYLQFEDALERWVR